MRYQVPQFIEVEDKIFGPLTARQFIYLAGGGGVALAAFSTLPVIWAGIISMPIAGLAIALAFYKVNGQPFIKTLENAFTFLVGKKLYLWSSEHPRLRKHNEPTSQAPKETVAYIPKLTESKLRELTWSLNIKDATAPQAIEEDERIV